MSLKDLALAISIVTLSAVASALMAHAETATPTAAAPVAAASVPAVPQKILVTISDVDFKHLGSAPEFNWGFNPFLRKPGYALVDAENDTLTPAKFQLDAIIFDKEDPVAIINERTVGVGDHIEGLEVEEIASNYVTLRGLGYHFELSMPPAREPASTSTIEPSPQTPKKEKSK